MGRDRAASQPRPIAGAEVVFEKAPQKFRFACTAVHGHWVCPSKDDEVDAARHLSLVTTVGCQRGPAADARSWIIHRFE
jgi:hypothetical protein